MATDPAAKSGQNHHYHATARIWSTYIDDRLLRLVYLCSLSSSSSFARTAGCQRQLGPGGAAAQLQLRPPAQQGGPLPTLGPLQDRQGQEDPLQAQHQREWVTFLGLKYILYLYVLLTSGQFHKNTDSRNASTQAFGNPDSPFYVIGPELLQFFSWRIQEYGFYGIGHLMREFFSWRIRRIRIPQKSFENSDSQMLELKNCGNPYFYGIGRWSTSAPPSGCQL